MLSDRIRARLELSKLVSYLNHLDSLNEVKRLTKVKFDLGLLFTDIAITDIEWSAKEQFVEIEKLLDQTIDKIHPALHEMRKQVVAEIAQGETEYFRRSRLFYQNTKTDTVNHILNRQIEISEEVHELFLSRLNVVADWKYPGIIIRPGIRPYVNTMVSCDPLYLVDADIDLLNPVIAKQEERYQRRLRKIIVDENEPEFLLSKIPVAQIGMVLCMDYFEYKTIEVINQYLVEMFQLLRPGGMMIFTYNNCDLAGGVILVEARARCYTPGVVIKQLVLDIGFTIHDQFDYEDSISWMEISKPGELTSLRGGQSLARIVAKNQ